MCEETRKKIKKFESILKKDITTSKIDNFSKR